MDANRTQISLSWLLAVPVLVAPLFVGFATGRLVLPDMQEFVRLTIFLLVYVTFVCWLAIRHFDRLSEFRRFPFRGSLLLGGTAGLGFTVQFALGAVVMLLSVHAHRMTLDQVGLQLLVAVLYSLVGGFIGLYFGLVAGGLYCAVRVLAPSRSDVIPKSHRPYQWREETDNVVIPSKRQRFR